jgi:reactive intermediate/imine deaminase
MLVRTNVHKGYFLLRKTMSKSVIHTSNAPAAIGTYSQAVKAGNTVYLSGQIPLVPSTMEMVSEDFEAQAVQVFENIKAVVKAAGGTTANLVKVNIFLTDLGQFATVNEVMARYFTEPYPARAAVQVSALPKGSQIEIDAVMVLPE